MSKNTEKPQDNDALTGALISLITHDIVGPLSFDANILGLLAAKDAVLREDMEILRSVHDSLVQISEKASGLLLMARSMHAAAGAAISAEQPGSQVTELTALLRGVSEFITDHNPGFSYEIETAGGVKVKGPSAVLRTAVENVLSNAARHGKKGTEVYVRMYVEGDVAVIAVENTVCAGKVSSGELGIGLDMSRKLLSACFGGTLETTAENGIFRSEIRIPAEI